MIGVALSTRALVKRYGRRTALDGFSISVPQGAVVGMVGPNGAGKTTWMMTVAGFLRRDGGEIDVLGQGQFNAAIHSGRVSILPQDSELPLESTAQDLLFRYARLQGLSVADARASVDGVLAAVNLADRARSPIRSLSHGMRKRVMLAQCFLGEPELVLLDEPLNGLDPTEQDRMRRFILERRGRQTIIISSHNLHDVELVCTHVAFVEKGRVARMDTVASLTREAGRVAYHLANLGCEGVADLEQRIRAALPNVDLAWNGADELVCRYDAKGGDLATVNRAILPLLLAVCDVLSVSSGLSLEQAYLNR